ncbi:MAG: hypothetical protein AB7K41_09480 [Bdellovibrionales bacterium]
MYMGNKRARGHAFWAGFLTLFLSFVFHFNGAAQTTDLSVPTLSASAKTFSQASLEFSNSQFLRASEPYFREGASSSLTSWKLGWKARAQRRGWFANVDARNDYQSEEDHHYIKPFDLATGWGNENNRFILGRQRQDWSVADDLWRIGMWQPRFTDDQITRENGGFTGAFAKFGNDDAHLLLFGSPYWIPDTQASFELKNQKFVSKNPWFKPPTNIVNLDGIPTDVRYNFDRPSVEDVIKHGMAAAQFEYRPTTVHFARVSAAYKPLNQLIIGFPLELHLEDPNYAQIDVKTRVLYQQLLTFEAGVRDQDGYTAWWSVTSDRPFRDNPPPEWTTQEVKDAVIGSVYVGRDLRGSGPNATHAYISYLRVEGGDAPDRGEFKGTKSLFEPRYMFQDAVQVGLRHTAPLLTRKWLAHFSGNVIYDFAQHGVMASAKIAQPFGKAWSALLSGDVIGLVDKSGRVQEGFISTYRANDRVSAGVQYVF